MKHYYSPKILFPIALIGLTFLLAFNLKSPMWTNDMDAYTRSLLAKELITKPWQGWLAGAWLPFHFLILSTSMLIFRDFYFSPRLVTLILSMGSVFMLYLYSKAILDKYISGNLVAYISATLYLFLPLRYILSFLTLSDPVFVFFLVLSLWSILKTRPNITLGLIFLNVAHGIRYESWFLTPFFCLLIWLTPKIPFKKKLLYCLGVFVFIGLWIWYNYHETGSPFMFLQDKIYMAHLNDIPEYGNVWLSFKFWWTPLVKSVGLLSIIFYGVGGIKIFKQKSFPSILTWFMPSYLFLSLVMQVYLGTMEWAPHRFLLILITLAIPFVVLGLFSVVQLLRFLVFTITNKTIHLIWVGSGILLLLLFNIISTYPYLKSENKIKDSATDWRANAKRLILWYRKNISCDFKKNDILYFKSENEADIKWMHVMVGYFLTGRPVWEGTYSQIDIKSQYDSICSGIILEKDSDFPGLPSNLKPIYTNDDFIVVERM